MCINMDGKHLDSHDEVVDLAIVKNLTDEGIKEALSGNSKWWPQSYVDVVVGHIITMVGIRRKAIAKKSSLTQV